jgi:hypothetical protein
VWRGFRKLDFFIYSSITGYFKKPILQDRGAKTFFYLTSMSKSAYLRSEYPAYIVFAFVYKQGREAILSQSAALHSTGNVTAEEQ